MENRTETLKTAGKGNNSSAAHKWARSFIALFFVFIVLAAGFVIWVDPFFLYHKPLTNTLKYTIEIQYQRYYNAGIIKNFDYDSVIIGTSLTEFFRPSEVKSHIDGNYIKVPFSGGSWLEINDHLRLAEETHNVRNVIRPIDYFDAVQLNRGYGANDYPSFLYDSDLLNDVKYIFNLDTVFVCIRTIRDTVNSRSAGITSFDDYCNWDTVEFSRERVLSGFEFHPETEQPHLSDNERENLIMNMENGITALAKAHPETTFYYFIPPYSTVYWSGIYNNGNMNHRLESEQLLIEKALQIPNLKLFSFAMETDITSDLDNYCDGTHYSPAVNSMILEKMASGENLLTEDNYRSYLEDLKDYYMNYPYQDLAKGD